MKIKKLKTGSSKHIQLKQLVCTHIYSKVGNKTEINESLYLLFSHVCFDNTILIKGTMEAQQCCYHGADGRISEEVFKKWSQHTTGIYLFQIF